MFNPSGIFRLKDLKEQFLRNHPKFLPFLKAVQTAGIREGMIVELTVTEPDGQVLRTNIRVRPSDVELYRELSQIAEKA